MRFVLAALLILVACWGMWLLSRDLLPPKSVAFAAGGEGGGYWQIAQSYREILARDGISVEILATKGSVENARLIAEGRAEIALLQGGVAIEEAESLGAVFAEPLFIFQRSGFAADPVPAHWRGYRISVGGEGSGTRAAWEGLVDAARISPEANTIDARGGAAAVDALIAGEVDLAIFVAPLSAPYLTPLLTAPEIRIYEPDHILAISRRLEQSQLLTLPSGAASFSPAVPEVDRQVLAMIAQVVSTPDLHPSLVDRVVEAAREIHGGRDAITDEGTYPSMDTGIVPQDSYAAALIADGPSPLQQYLPYWVVAQINRFAILLLPILVLILPLLNAVPAIYAWRQRGRVFRYYPKIREIDSEVQFCTDKDRLRELASKLTLLDLEIAGLRLPMEYRDFAYTARSHIDLVRSRIKDTLDT